MVNLLSDYSLIYLPADAQDTGGVCSYAIHPPYRYGGLLA